MHHQCNIVYDRILIRISIQIWGPILQPSVPVLNPSLFFVYMSRKKNSNNTIGVMNINFIRLWGRELDRLFVFEFLFRREWQKTIYFQCFLSKKKFCEIATTQTHVKAILRIWKIFVKLNTCRQKSYSTHYSATYNATFTKLISRNFSKTLFSPNRSL